MANNTYGTKKPALVTSNDVDIFYHYRPTRSSDSSEFVSFKKLDSSLLSSMNVESGGEQSVLPGMYDLKLPLGSFGSAGIYTIYIKPKEIITNIVDVSTLSAYPNIRGVVLSADSVSNVDESIFNDGELVGYRIEYFENGERMPDYRIITSNNRCEPVSSSMTYTYKNGITYTFSESSDLVFCTVTPSVAMPYKSSSAPYIGKTSQKIALINTKFNPVMMEIEMTEHDIESIATMLEGDQIRNLDKALITTFNRDGGLYNQSAYGHIVNTKEGINHDFRLNNTTSIIFDEQNKFEKIKPNVE